MIKKTCLLLILFLLNGIVLKGQPGLIGQFELDGNGTDASTLAIDGTVFNAVPADGIQGMEGTAMQFNGTDAYIDCTVDSRGIKDTFAVSAWIKTTSIDNRFIVTKYNYNEDRGFHFGINEGYLRLGGRNNSGEYSNTGPSSTFISDGEWHHVVGMIYGNTWEIWVDCELEAMVNSTSSNPSLDNSEPLTIGHFHLEDNRYFDGTIDNVNIYNSKISEELIDTFLCKENLILSTEENQSDSKQNLSPHVIPSPTNGWLKIIAAESISKTEIYDLSGKLVLKINNPERILDLSQLTNGMYVVQSTSQRGNIYIDKIVLTK